MGQRLKALRTEAGLSGRELSELAGLTANHVQHIEGSVPAGVEARTVLRLANIFGATMDWLYAGRGRGPTAKERAQSLRRALRRAGRVGPTGG